MAKDYVSGHCRTSSRGTKYFVDSHYRGRRMSNEFARNWMIVLSEREKAKECKNEIKDEKISDKE